MARKTILVCDNCGNEVDEGKGAMMRVNYTDARRRSKQADLCAADRLMQSTASGLNPTTFSSTAQTISMASTAGLFLSRPWMLSANSASSH